MWERFISKGSPTPLPQGGWAQVLHNFWGSFLFMRTPLVAQIWRGNTCPGGACYLAVNHSSHLKRAEFQCSPIFAVLLYLCLCLLTQYDQIWRSNTYGEAVLLGGQPRYCVALFVHDNWFSCSLYKCYSYGSVRRDARYTRYLYNTLTLILTLTPSLTRV